MNKHVLALSTALSILAFTPAFAQTTPAVDCTQQANKSDPACMNQNNNTNATQTQTQGQSGTATTTDQNAAQTGSSTTTTTTDQNAQAPAATTTTDQNAQAPAATTTTDQNAQTTTTTQSTTTQASTGELIVPADRLNGAQMMSANDYIGKTVYDQAGNNIGDVNDLIISQDGQIQAVILGVGGFLGIGEKDVAVNTSAIKMVQDGDNTRLVVQTTKEALNSAPTYDKKNRRYATQSTTTTETTGSTTQPAPAPAPADTTTGNTSGSATVDCTKAANASDPACANKTQTQQ